MNYVRRSVICFAGQSVNLPHPKLSAANVRIVVNGHAPFLAAIKASYEALREQSGKETREVSLPELLSKYTLSDNYREWAKTYLKSEHVSD